MSAKKLTLNQTLTQKQKLVVDQRILGVPLLLVEQTLQKLLQDPVAFESKISQMAGEGDKRSGTFYEDNPLFYGNLFRAINGSQSSSSSDGVTGGMGSIGESLQQVPNILFSEPDITYHVKGFGDFSMIPADHFKPSNLSPLLLQLPKKVVPFAQWLIGQKHWIIKTVSEC